MSSESRHTPGPLGRFDSIGHSIAFAEACLLNGADATTAKRAADDLHQALADVGAIRELAPAMLEALKLAEDVLSRSPFSTQMWPNGMHPNAGIEIIRAAIEAAQQGEG